MSAQNSRKRAAPGAAPMAPYQQRMQQPYIPDNNVGVTDPMMRWNGTGDGADFIDSTAHPANQYGLVPAQPQFGQPVPTPSNSLTRRPTNQALVPTNPRANYDSSVEPWTGFGDDSNALLQQNNGEGLVEQDNVEVLEEMAAKAKREAQSKRKQIPPFVQKLSSFLEERKNEDLIRWSEKGDSFIVLDEDEFAKTLIPELFKHNNYASFVRQLNMYGFHKRVGLSDNSMRASERKNKSPSDPRVAAKLTRRGQKNAEGEAESDEDAGQEESPSQGQGASSAPAGRSLPAAESPPLQKKEMAVIREELNKVREQQKMILGAITQLQRNNNDLYNQAMMFQNQHDRHQNSINAILNFLANVFRKTLEDGSHQNVGDIISSMMTNQVPGGPCVQYERYSQASAWPAAPIPNQNEGMKASRSPSAASTPYHAVGGQNPEMGTVTELLDSDTPPTLRQELETNPQERMMKIINDHNATNTSGMDLPEAAKLVANAPNTLNQDQQSKLVDLMSRQTSSPSSTSPTPAPAPSGRAPAAAPPPSSAPAGVSPPPTSGAAAPSLSPILRSPTMQPPSLNQINANQIDLGQLSRLQSEQDAKIHELSEMLGPLSPSGHIPGLGDGNEAYFDPPNVDLDQYFDSNAFLNDANFGGDGTDFNFGLDHHDAQNPLDNHPETKSGKDTPSPTDTEEIQRDDFGNDSNPSRDNKRQRVG
ncbi:hypothetical protein ACCO45_005000 [Purpureocillium lilacinum]|uniref:Uncharacterized protein n=1 Tax=Purpureocillium lilacinum TaxID=33203 RepID=A0ACC4DV54_PURLI